MYTLLLVLIYIAFISLGLPDSLLGSGMSSRLFKNLRDQEGLAYQMRGLDTLPVFERV